jgi:hypothetical protein
MAINQQGDLPVKSFNLKARPGITAALTAMLLTGFVSNTHAAVSARDSDLQIAPSIAASTASDLDGSCTPPSDLATCAAWHKAIRANFTPREIGILFGTATSYPEYATSYLRIKSRYEQLHDDFSATRLPEHTVSAR